MAVLIKYTMPDVVPEGTYLAELVSVGERSVKSSDGTDVWEYIDFTFRILDGEHKGQTVRGSVPKFLSPGSRLEAWLRAMKPRTFARGEEVDLEDYIGSKVSVYVEERVAPSGARFYDVARVRSLSDVERKIIEGLAKEEEKTKTEKSLEKSLTDLEDIPF